jgi:hypothetical protein
MARQIVAGVRSQLRSEEFAVICKLFLWYLQLFAKYSYDFCNPSYSRNYCKPVIAIGSRK